MRIARIVLSLVFCLTGCSGAETNKRDTGQPQAHAESASAELATLFSEHFEKNLALNPSEAQAIGDYRFNHLFGNDLTDDYLASAKALNSEFLRRAQAIDPEALSERERLSRSFFIYLRTLEEEAEQIPQHLLPLNQFDSRALGFAQLGSGESLHPFKTEKDYRDFLKKAEGFDEWVDSAILRMQEGMEKGIVLPRVLIERSLPQLEAQFSGDMKTSTFYSPLTKLPASISGAAKEALLADYKKAIAELIAPSYEKLHRFMSSDYLAKGIAQHGINALPGGERWYKYLIKYHTTTDMSPDEIHELGLAEVKRIRDEMNEVRRQVGFKGDLKAFFEHLSTDEKYFFSDRKDLIAGYSDLKERIDAMLPRFFDVTPKAAYEVRPVESFREQSAAGASYEAGTPDGTRPGVFYINTFNLKAQPRWGMETLSLHEAAPGHHFQISIQQEMQDAPKFQRFSGSTAFAEGWALYAESLGKEMGLFADPLQYFGRLSDELLRAMRLVVDTGLHAKGWTRDRALRYMLDNSAMTESDLTAEVERYMALPGQALAYKIGQLKISELRRLAEERMGDRFELREFHNQVLLDGSLPMTILEQKVESWLRGPLDPGGSSTSHGISRDLGPSKPRL